MSSRRGEYLEGKVYVGGLPNDVRTEEVEDVFRRYGKIRKIWVAKRPPGFGFVEYEDARDAEDSVRALDGTKIGGQRIKVELSHGKSRNTRGGGGGSGRNGGGDRNYDRRRSRSPRRRASGSPPPKRSRSPKKDAPRSPRRSFSRSRSVTPQ